MYRQVRKTITAAQVRLIKTLQGRLNWDDETYRANLSRLANVTSCKDLTQGQARHVIDFMRAELGEDAPAKLSKASMTPTADRLTAHQREYIVNLWWRVSRGQTSLQKSNGLRAFILRQTGCTELRFVPRNQGPALICAIKAMAT